MTRAAIPRLRQMAPWFLMLGLPVAVVACEEFGVPAGTEPHRELNFLDMADQPKGKAQRGDLLGGADFMPPEGAIPQGFTPYPYVGHPELAEQTLTNPLDAADPAVVKRGELMYSRYCVPCHDAKASGNGLVVQKGFPPPPSLQTQRVRDFRDGRIFHIITTGQNIMPSYAAQVRERDRWAIVHYLRQLHTTEPVAPPSPATAAPSPSASSEPADADAGSAGGANGESGDAGVAEAGAERSDAAAEASLGELLGDELGIAPGLMPPPGPRYGAGEGRPAPLPAPVPGVRDQKEVAAP